MEITARARASAAPSFEDGFGKRHYLKGPGGEPLEVLILRDALTAQPGISQTVQLQIDRLAGFQHPSCGQVRGIARVVKSDGGLGIVSEHVRGERLSNLLAAAEIRHLPLDMKAAFWMIGQLVRAVALFHERVPGVCHGAIAPERIIITPDARVVLVEHVLGSVLEQTAWPRDRFWKELRVAVPPGDDPVSFDQRTDVAQVGVVAMALLLGHPLGDEYPARIGGLMQRAADLSAADALELLPDGIRGWMARALQLEAGRSFASAVDARVALDLALDDADYVGAPEALKAFLDAYHGGATVENAGRDDIRSAPSESHAPAAPSATILPRIQAEPRIEAEPPIETEPRIEAEPQIQSLDESAPPPVGRFGRRRLIAAVAAVLIAASATSFAARRYFNSAPPALATGTLIVNTSPDGVAVTVDGVRRGETPLRIALDAGDHVLGLSSGTAERTIPFSVTAGSQVSHFLEMPTQPAPQLFGQLQIRTEPSGARISIDGQDLGRSPLSVGRLEAGPHTVKVESDLGAVVERVIVQAGTTVSLVVPLSAPAGTPASGWIAVNAPAEVQIYENRRLVGSSRSERIMTAAGRHELEITNEALGYHATRTAVVTPGQVTTLALDWPSGSLALNAQPWADVWIDGERSGETPLGNVTLPIGPHEILFRHPELGEKRYTAVVTLGSPVRITADLRTK
jgi:hypothetical protein